MLCVSSWDRPLFRTRITTRFLLLPPAGPKYLVAPVTAENATTRTLYFPARPAPTHFRVLVCAARTLNAAGQSRVTLSLR